MKMLTLLRDIRSFVTNPETLVKTILKLDQQDEISNSFDIRNGMFVTNALH